MKILLTGATGYIGKRLLPTLVKNGYKVVCCVRDIKRFNPPKSISKELEVIEIDLFNKDSLLKIPKDIDGAYYLVHSMTSKGNYEEVEHQCAYNFRQALSETKARHVIYLGGITNEDQLSKHLTSRKNVEMELAKGNYHFTSLRAGIIIGSGSASFEIIRDLVEKLPIMIAPKWLGTKSQPIAIADVIEILTRSIFLEETFNKKFDIGGPEVLTYKQMLMGYAEVRKLKRVILTVPVMTPRLSSYWLYFVTSTSYRLATALVDSMKVQVVCNNDEIRQIIKTQNIDYKTALNKAFSKIENNETVSSWKDSFVSSKLNINISDFIEVPKYGCLIDKRVRPVKNQQECVDKIWSIGGEKGWYYANWLWELRGFIDKVFFGGIGLRKGRTNTGQICSGDTIDCWRVLYANREKGVLLLFAEMKLPGEAWLEFRVEENELHQTATFRPKGVLGRLYWYLVLPFHLFIFNGMANRLAQNAHSV